MESAPLVPVQKGYSTVQLPNELLAAIDRFVESNQMGYKSRPEVVKTAVRRFLEEQSR